MVYQSEKSAMLKKVKKNYLLFHKRSDGKRFLLGTSINNLDIYLSYFVVHGLRYTEYFFDLLLETNFFSSHSPFFLFFTLFSIITKMKFTVAAVFTALVSAVYAQTTPANAGVAVTHPGLGVSSPLVNPCPCPEILTFFFSSVVGSRHCR